MITIYFYLLKISGCRTMVREELICSSEAETSRNSYIMDKLNIPVKLTLPIDLRNAHLQRNLPATERHGQNETDEKGL